MATYILTDDEPNIDLSDQQPGPGNNTNDTIIGTDGDNIIIAGPADPVDGVNDNDVVEGGLGDDTMTGGYGNDKFVFNFSYATQDYYFLGLDNAIGGTGENADADHPSLSANINAWNNAYAAWLASLGGEATPVGGTSSFPVGNVNPQLFTYYNQVSVTALTGDGDDTITDFTHSGAGSNDSLVFVGITAEQAIALMSTSVADVNGDTVLDTVIHAGDSSITLLGVSDFGSIADAIAAHKIDFA